MSTYFTIDYSYLIPRSTIYKSDIKIINKKNLLNTNDFIKSCKYRLEIINYNQRLNSCILHKSLNSFRFF